MVTGREEEFRRLFVQEAAGQLERMGQRALDLESAGRHAEAIAELFRHAHTLKSSSTLVGFDAVSVVAHALEDLFEELRSGARQADKRTVDAILLAVDVIQEMVPALMRGEDRDAAAAGTAAALRNVTRGGPADVPQAPSPALAAEPELGSAYVRMPLERLDAIVRLAGEAVAARLGVGAALSEQGAGEPEAIPPYSALGRALDALQDEALRARMVSFGSIAGPLRRAARDVAATEGKRVRWELSGESTELDRHVLELLRDPLLHLVRNAVDHGIEAPRERVAAGKPEEGVVRVAVAARGHEVLVSVSDDGRGIDFAQLRELAGEGSDPLELIFQPGFSTAPEVTGFSGRGVGLDVVRAALAEVRGRVDVETEPGRGTEFRIVTPMTLALVPCLLAAVGGERYAIPLHAAEAIVDDPPEAELSVEGRPSLRTGDELVPVTSLASALGRGDGARGPAVVLAGATRRHAFRVEELVGRRDVVVKELGPVVGRIDVLAGAAVEPDGSLMLVLDPAGLVARGRAAGAAAPPAPEPGPAVEDAPLRPKGRVLVVDDALTVRELQRSILERAGYEVEVAADGEAALAALAGAGFDLVLTDVEMPRMDGFRLIETIRARPQLAGLPVIVITSHGDEADRRRGLEAGADAYIVKSAFDERALLEAVERALGATG